MSESASDKSDDQDDESGDEDKDWIEGPVRIDLCFFLASLTTKEQYFI